MNTFFRSWVRRWDHFWFAPTETYHLALFRVVLALTLLTMYSIRIVDFDFFYGKNAFLPGSNGWDLLPSNMIPLWRWFPESPAITYVLHVALLVGLVLLLLGLGGRLITFALYILQLGFFQQNFAVSYGADVIAFHWLLYLSLTRHNDHLNVLNLFRKRAAIRLRGGATRVGLRLIQIQVALIYGFSGFEKLKGGPWWDGSAVWVTLSSMDLVDYDFSFLSQLPLLAFLASFLPLIWEIYFPVLIIQTGWRPWVLGFGVMFHFMIGWIMHLPFFGLVMTSSYFVFFNSVAIERRVKNFLNPLRLRGFVLNWKSNFPRVNANDR
jgi:hypothetical protein